MTHPYTFEETLRQLHHDRDWRERAEAVRKLAVLGTDEAMQAILSALYDESPHVRLEAAGLLTRFGQRSLPDRLKALYESQDSELQRTILHNLWLLSDPEHTPHFLHFLNSPDPALRHTAAYRLADFPNEHIVRVLLDVLKQPDPPVAPIARAILKQGDPDAINALIPFLTTADHGTRQDIAVGLGRLRTEQGLQALLAASHHQDANVRLSIVLGLGIHDSKAALQRLCDMLEEEAESQHAALHDQIELALHLNQQNKSLPPLNQHNFLKPETPHHFPHAEETDRPPLSLIPKLMERYRQNYVESKELEFFAYHYFRYESLSEAVLLQAIEALHSFDQRLRIAAVWLLKVFCDDWDAHQQRPETQPLTGDLQAESLKTQAVRHLIVLLEDQNPDIRLCALETLADTMDERAFAGIVANLMNPDSIIAVKAKAAMRHVPAPSIPEELAEKAREGDLYGIVGLAQMGGDNALDRLLKLLDDDNQWTRGRAASSLGRLGDVRAMPRLIEKVYTETDGFACDFIISALGHLKDKRATQAVIDYLIYVLRQEPFDIVPVSMALIALQQIADEASLPALYAVVDLNIEPYATDYAIKAISAVGTDTEKAQRLFKFLEHELGFVRTIASTRLGYLGAASKDLDLRDEITTRLIERLKDQGEPFFTASSTAGAAAKSLYFIGTTEAIQALKTWKLKKDKPEE